MKLITIGLPMAIASILFSSASFAISESTTKGSGYDYFASNLYKKPVEIKVISTDFDLENARANAKASTDILGRQGVYLVNNAMKHSPFYALLATFEQLTPTLAKSVRYAVLLQEINHTNQKLDALLIAMKKNNQYLSEVIEIVKLNQARGGQ